MLGDKNIGNVICELRKQAGYSQKQLAELLNITDKAISKWERGLSFPDVALLPKLSSLLDADIESLLGNSCFYPETWQGVLDLSEVELPLDSVLYDKPMVYYFLSNFILTGIRNIIIVINENQDEEFLASLSKKNNFGLKIEIKRNLTFKIENVFYIKGAYFIFGAGLTRFYQSFMSFKNENIQILHSNNSSISMNFVTNNNLKKVTMNKCLGRGIIVVPLQNYNDLTEAASFIKFFQNTQKQKISDLGELASIRGFIQ